MYSTAPAMSTECFLSYVPGTFGNVAAQEGKSLEEWQNELREEEVMKEDYRSLESADSDLYFLYNSDQLKEEYVLCPAGEGISWGKASVCQQGSEERLMAHCARQLRCTCVAASVQDPPLVNT